MADHPFPDKHASARLSLSFPAHFFALITQEALRNRERIYWKRYFDMFFTNKFYIKTYISILCSLSKIYGNSWCAGAAVLPVQTFI